MEELKVSSKTDPKKLAGAIASVLKEGGQPELQCVGAGAVNQANKALAIARTFVVAEGKDVVFTVAFKNINIENEEKTAIVLRPEMRG